MPGAKKSIVIVGGGHAGSSTARLLSQKLDPSTAHITLINTRPFFTLLIASLRMAVTPTGSLEDTALIPFDKVFAQPGIGEVKVGVVTSVEDAGVEKGGVVVLEDGERVGYDVLVLAPGSKWTGVTNFPNGEKAESLAWVNEWRKQFKDAKSVLIVGGGAVGIELAGEIKDTYPETKVTIVHAGKQLTNDAYPPRFRKGLEKQMRTRGVELVLGEYVDDLPQGATEVTTRSGKTLSADVIVSARGPTPNTSFVRTSPSLGPDVLTPAGTVKVKPTLQLAAPSHAHIFAAGDVIDWAEQKQAFKTNGHATAVAANIVSILGGGKVSAVYKGAPEAILVTNGKDRGLMYAPFLWGIVLGDWISTKLKSRDLFIGPTRKALGHDS